MKLWCTEIFAIRSKNIEDFGDYRKYSGSVTKFCGPNVPGISAKDAQDYCENNGLGYCKVIGELIAEIPCKSGTFEPDFPNMIDYETHQNN